MAIVPVGNLSVQVNGCGSRRGFVEQILAQLQQNVSYVVSRCLEVVLSTEVTNMLDRKPFARRKPRRFRPGEIECHRCHERDPHQFRRNGHYRRRLDTKWGSLQIDVPQVECCRCGASGAIPFRTFRPRQRLWDDISQSVRRQSAMGLSLREIQEALSIQLNSSVGLRTINQRIHQAESVLLAEQEQVLADVPPVVRLDGIWLKVMLPTDDHHLDRAGRNRLVKCAVRLPVLAAQGVWPTTGRHEILAWTIGRDEDQASWEELLNRLLVRGVTPDRGLRLLVADGSAGLEAARPTVFWDVPFQRCVFHKLRNIWRDVVLPKELSDRAAKQYRRRLMRSAARIWQAPTAAEARQRRDQLVERWRQAQPAAMATLDRHFEDTLTFYDLLVSTAASGTPWPARALRTTSPLEREFRAWRKRLRSAVLFHSLTGLRAVIAQFLFRRSARRSDSLPEHWPISLERLIAAFPE